MDDLYRGRVAFIGSWKDIQIANANVCQLYNEWLLENPVSGDLNDRYIEACVVI